MSRSDFHDAVVWITGAGSGIGAATAELAAQRGATVIASDISREALERLRPSLVRHSPRSEVFPLDVTDAASCEKMTQSIVEQFGRLDVLVASAGVMNRTVAISVTPEEWDAVHAVNLRGLFFCSQAAARVMMRQRSGAIVLISSQLALIGRARTSVYAASKGGVTALVRTLAVEWAPFGIRVNAVAPGPTLTPMLGTDEERHRELASHVPLGRLGTAIEQAYAVLFLASNEASFITGAVLPVDGGYTAQ